MNGKKIEIEVDEEGNTKVTFQGFQGKQCFDEAEKIYISLGKSGINLIVSEIKEQLEQQGQNVREGNSIGQNTRR